MTDPAPSLVHNIEEGMLVEASTSEEMAARLASLPMPAYYIAGVP